MPEPFRHFDFKRDKEGWHLVQRYPARGVQKRTQTKSQIPYSTNRGLSNNAKLLKAAIDGNERDEALLARILGQMVADTAKAQNWGLKGDVRGLAVIALRPYIFLEELTQQAAADECSVPRSTYLRNWSTDKLGEVRKWVKTIHAELN